MSRKKDAMKRTCSPAALTPPGYSRGLAPCCPCGQAGTTADLHGLPSEGTRTDQVKELERENYICILKGATSLGQNSASLGLRSLNHP